MKALSAEEGEALFESVYERCPVGRLTPLDLELLRARANGEPLVSIAARLRMNSETVGYKFTRAVGRLSMAIRGAGDGRIYINGG